MCSIVFLSQLQEIVLFPFGVITITMFVFVTFVTKWIFFTTPSNKNLPPSPAKIPIIGNLHQLGFHPHRSLRSFAQRYGPIMLLHLGRKPTIVISSAKLAREIMKTHDIIFANRPNSAIARKLLYNYKDLSCSPYGEYWRQMRSICVMRLLTAKRVLSFRSIREEETVELMKKVERSCLRSSPIDLSETLVSLTNNIICRVAFGKKYCEGEGGKKLKKLLEELGELLGVFSVGDFIPWLAWLDRISGLNARVERVFKEIDSFLNRVIDDHVTLELEVLANACVREDQMDFVDVLLDIQKDSCNGICMDRENIKAIILDMFVGATDTTYTAIEWALTEVIRHPEVMKKAQEEVRGISGSKALIDETDLQKMQYLQAVIKESLRLHPPIPLLLPRQPSKDVQVGGYNISSKTRVIINAFAIGRDTGFWEEPEKFIPERFMDASVDFKGHDFQFIPFGAGRRGCPGATFAVAVIEVVLANLLHRFNWAMPGEARGEELDVIESNGIAIHRKFPLLVFATPHS